MKIHVKLKFLKLYFKKKILVVEDVLALLFHIKSFNINVSIILSYEERGLISSLPIQCKKWGFKLENIQEYLEFEKVLIKENIISLNEIHFFQLK